MACPLLPLRNYYINLASQHLGIASLPLLIDLPPRNFNFHLPVSHPGSWLQKSIPLAKIRTSSRLYVSSASGYASQLGLCVASSRSLSASSTEYSRIRRNLQPELFMPLNAKDHFEFSSQQLLCFKNLIF